ncbi:MAG: rsbV [Acidimicrobiales bacterium]|jgi:anti-sigma B factor antagonist|nr:rsbV [Acidimicrobiales bacterium]
MAEPVAAHGELRVDVSDVDGQSVLTLAGDVDAYSSPQLRERLTRLIDDGALSLVLDLSGLQFLDSTGLGVLVGAQKRLTQADGELVLRSPRSGARKVFELTGLDQIFTIED